MAYFKVDILSPSKVVARGLSADSMSIPTCKGEINVLPEHTHVISQLDTGVVVLVESGKKKLFTVTHGICKVLKDKVTILSSCTEKADEIDLDRAQKAKKKALEKLSGKEHLSEDDAIKFRRKLMRADARIRVCESR